MTSSKYLVPNPTSMHDDDSSDPTMLQIKCDEQARNIKVLRDEIATLRALSDMKGEKISILKEQMQDLKEQLQKKNNQNRSPAFTASGLTTPLI